MPKLSNSDARTIRHAREAVALLMTGAVRQLETNYGPNDDPERRDAVDALILHVREELDGWATRHEDGERDAELTVDETRLTEDVG